MTKIRVYDKALCCSTGVCGVQVDPVLPRFAADLEWLVTQGHDVSRYNLAQDPAEFAGNQDVQAALADEGIECLPLVIVDGRIVSRGEYPKRDRLADWAGTTTKPISVLPIATDSGCGDGGTGCC